MNLSDNSSATIFECANKLWQTDTIPGKCASLDVMKHLTLLGFKFAGAEGAYHVAMTENDPVVREAALKLLASLLIKQQKGVLQARQIIFNVTLNPDNSLFKKDAMTLFEALIDHCQLQPVNDSGDLSLSSTVLPKLELIQGTTFGGPLVWALGAVIGSLLILKMSGYHVCIHKSY